MIEAGQVVLLRFPYADAGGGKLRPALVLARLPGPYDDWLVSMISSRLHQAVRGIDEIVLERDADFSATGLKTASVIRVTRLAVVASDRMEGALGRLAITNDKRGQTMFSARQITRPPLAVQGPGESRLHPRVTRIVACYQAQLQEPGDIPE